MFDVVLPHSSSVSTSIIELTASLLEKETHEAAVAALASTLLLHLIFLLKMDVPILAGTAALIMKEMSSSKPPVRRAFVSLVGCKADINFSTGNAFEFEKAILPVFDNYLKTSILRSGSVQFFDPKVGQLGLQLV
jgi:Generalcontrol nonderepressible 1 (Gcn1) N-terminal